MASGKGDLDDLAGRLHDVVDHQETGHRRPDEDDVALIREIVLGRSFPAYDITAEADEREAAADRLTQEQAALLKVTRLITRMEVRGGAASGKTILALTQAKDLTRGQGERRPQRVALLCYSIGLSEYVKRQLATVNRHHRPAFVGNFEDLARHWGITEFADRDDSDFWERRLPEQMPDIAAELPEAQRFDAIIVDEAQDFADLWWRALMKALRDEEQGGLYVYTDENQRIFARFGRPPVPLVPLILDHNLRNTQQIAKAFGPLAPMRMHLRGGEGAEVTFVPCERDAVIDGANDQVDQLLDEGWRPEHVALLTAKEMLYVGMSRATDRLIVVGDRHVVREIGGEQVAFHLGIG